VLSVITPAHVGPIDTNTFELEQGAAVPADLLQQEPLVEVAGFKPSVTLSGELILAGGFPTIRLQTKKLSGAQRKKFTRARKMNEGTWTVKNPPRKAPSSQEMDGM
jgi:hypothetical protein